MRIQRDANRHIPRTSTVAIFIDEFEISQVSECQEQASSKRLSIFIDSLPSHPMPALMWRHRLSRPGVDSLDIRACEHVHDSK